MKLISYSIDSNLQLGISIDEKLYSISNLLKAIEGLNTYTIDDFFEDVESNINKINKYVENKEILNYLIHENNIELEAPTTSNAKIICVGLNYRKHAKETGMDLPKEPLLFSKFSNALIGSGKAVEIPEETEQLDYEAELAIVIGKETKNVSTEEALDYVAGYCTSNDLSARDLQFKTSQWLIGKSCDGFLPIGPYLVTKDEITDPNNLSITTKVNNEVRQSSNTNDMIFKCDEIISYISKYITLLPGDVIITGTPEGVVHGLNQSKGYLKKGDIVEITIENLGTLTTSFI